MNKVLEITNLKKIYHSKEGETLALDNISFTVKEGEFISIVGPSGCGKSTILSILSNTLDKSSGEINLNNKKIAYMLQNDCLLEYLTVLDNCLIGLKIQGKITNSDKEYVINLLNNYGLSDFINKYPSNLSGGMKQRVALIRTLALKPDILLLDEPTSALDYQTSLTISNDISKIIRQEQKTAIMVTHDISQAISMSDKVIVLTKRPATIKSIYNLKFTSNNPLDRRKENIFTDYYEKIWEDLDIYE